MDKLEKFSAIDRTDKWMQNSWMKVTADDPVVDLENDLPLWRNRSRFLCYNNPVAKAPIQNIGNLTIGAGIFPNPLIDVGDSRKNHEIISTIIKLYEEWASEAHIDGTTDISSVLRQIVSSIFRDGDVLAYITTVDDTSPFKIDLIDASRIETPPDKKSNNNIRIGVEISNRRVIKKYWVKIPNGYKSFALKDRFGRILSILLKNPYMGDMINSYRGIPALAPCISTVEDLNAVLKDELRATKINRSKIGVVTTQGPNVSDSVEAISDEIIGSIGYQKHGDLELLVMQNGDKLELHSGSDVSNPQVTNITKLYLKQIASVFNVPYNALYSDIDDNTYSTNQSILLEGWRSTEIIRKYLIQNLLKPLYKMNLERWIQEGKIPYIKEYTDELGMVQFNGRAINSVKSKDHTAGQLDAIAGNLKSVQMATLENGDDPWQILRDKIEYEKELKYLQSLNNINVQTPEELKENDQIIKIVELYNSGSMTMESARSLLQDFYHYTDDEVQKIIPEKVIVSTIANEYSKPPRAGI